MTEIHVRTRTEAREWFALHGVTISRWAEAQGFSRRLVYQVLEGRIDGQRGEAHRIAVALRLKPSSLATEETTEW